MSNALPILNPGDHLLYGRRKWFDPIIERKTWSDVVHSEILISPHFTATAKPARGVSIYPLEYDGLLYVLRPNKPFDLQAGIQWFNTVQGQKYDLKGLLVFSLAVKQGAKDRQFCSEVCTRFGRMAGFEAFHENYDADRVAPAQFKQSPAFDWVWMHDKANKDGYYKFDGVKYVPVINTTPSTFSAVV